MQSPAVLVTSRQVQNVHTGLDLTVPQHQEVRGKMMSGHVEYQILGVTRLAVFKSAKHRPEDVVQFLVSKKYSEIEEFYQKLSNRYPAASLPPLPRKVLFVGESDIRERRAMFDEILRCISKDAQLAGSPELLEFLGTRSAGAAGLAPRDPSVLDVTASQPGDSDEAFDFFEQQDEVQPPTLGLSHKDVEKSLEEEEEEEEEALDPLGIMRSKKPKKQPEVAMRPKPSPRLTIFDEEIDPDAGLFSPGNKVSPLRPLGTTQDALKLFDDPDLGGAVSLGDPLLLPTARESGGPTSSPEYRGASKELFRVEEDLDQILNLGSEPKPKPQTKPKPLVPAKPALPKKPAVPPSVGPSETGAGPQKQQQIQAMDEMDILQYIQDHDTLAQASPSLF
ncbi:HCLS1-binding protein 3 [Onychomys torridus]|uniref:HCLS1-binding protein 3 n=1 Tax=Onychomys torridus TaxID=38674 RepID=UPI00167FC545|nr:HCLS1-binding protein 3 [Onychomys torridus]